MDELKQQIKQIEEKLKELKEQSKTTQNLDLEKIRDSLENSLTLEIYDQLEQLKDKLTEHLTKSLDLEFNLISVEHKTNTKQINTHKKVKYTKKWSPGIGSDGLTNLQRLTLGAMIPGVEYSTKEIRMKTGLKCNEVSSCLAYMEPKKLVSVQRVTRDKPGHTFGRGKNQRLLWTRLK